ncbi:hypothetical protein NDU88_006685 [Pleurodeles waltl]|uniref:Uncharacterized protein n=1 Tax=Pleurodeles waltl TaxID=8319 RepID=A0AAV7U0U5_PLEWA|nr:hypothetical protein NDU88_006685 [Pleurodeles waltl]
MQSCAQASRPPSRPGGRFRHRAHFAVTRGALSRLAPSCEGKRKPEREEAHEGERRRVRKCVSVSGGSPREHWDDRELLGSKEI